MKIIFKNTLLFFALIFSVLCLFYIIFRVYISLNGDDELLQNDSHLIPYVKNISDADNAYFDLKKSAEHVFYPEEKKDVIEHMISGSTWNDDLAREIIEKNEKAYWFFEQASQKKYIINPQFQEAEFKTTVCEEKIENSLFLREIQKTYLVSAIYDYKNGNKEDGIKKIIVSLDVVSKFNIDSSLTLVDYLVVLATKESIHDAIGTILTQGNLNGEHAILLQNALEKSRSDGKDLANAFRFEYFCMNSGLDEIATNIDNINKNELSFYKQYWNFYYKPNQTKNVLMRKFGERTVNRSLLSCEDMRVDDAETQKEMNGFYRHMMTENAVGKILVDIGNVSLEVVQQRRCLEDFLVLDDQIRMASASYKNDHGQLPNNINELTESDYLITKDVPAHIYGWDIIYDNKTGSLVYPNDIKR